MKKNIKTLAASILSAVAFSAISVGTTFALFTSEAKTTVNMTSGKIHIDADLENVVTYSAVSDPAGTIFDENHNPYRQDAQGTETVGGETHYLFSNTGYVVFDDDENTITIDRITPGDKVALSFDLGNDSNVSFKYRFSYAAVDTDNNPLTSYVDLIKGLTTSIQLGTEAAQEFKGLTNFESEWVVYAPTDEIPGLNLIIELPMDKGDRYQNLSAKIQLGFEAVQANAYTDAPSSATTIEEDIISAPVAATTGNDTLVTAASTESNVSFSVKVPADAEHSSGAGQIQNNDSLTLEVTDLGKTEEIYSTETSLNFDLTLKVNNAVVNDFTQPLEVKVYVGPGLIISGVTHNNTEVTNYSYNAETGYITFQTTSFSPFSVDFMSGVEVRTPAELSAALLGDKKIGLKADLTLSAFIPVGRNTTIIGFNHTITVNDTRALRIQDGNIELNMCDLNLVCGTGCQRGLQVDSNFVGEVINLDNVTISGATHYAINFCLSTQVDININNSTISGWAAINAYGSGNHINVSNSTLIGTNPYSGTSNSFCTICLEGDTTMHTDEHSSDYIIKIVNSEIRALSTGDQYQAILGFNNNALNSSVEFINCEFTLGEERCPFAYDISGNETNHIIIDGQELDYPRGVYFSLN